jgi:alkanesulfonate monooxygenase SsuD/methylene tetrahydromethanopterin reductase-like flavin-dependent oxidoreductase (luciferase family)
VIIGGRGPTRTPALAATYASEYNQAFGPLDDYRRQGDVVRSACEAVGRDPDELVYSAALVVCCGSGPAEVERRAANIGRQPDELAASGLCGTPAELLDRIERWRQEGMERLYVQVLDLDDLDHLALLGAEVLPHL